HGFRCLNRARALGGRGGVEDAGMVEGRAVSSADRVGEALFGAHILKQPGAKATGEYLVHHAESVVVGIVALSAEADDPDIALVYIAFVYGIHAWSGPMELARGLGPCRSARQRFTSSAEGFLHDRGIEVAGDGDNHIVGRKGLCVP